ncbi:unnamed protein product [Agarophyton chilense]|eukprot:gb/GEZJ01004137.1/.p2 GENE.gb/GEZJ01004137.1/~~gb/GEZJ01004137.1/.p2  ORF type:complete len:385 (-),score=77.02 gb/GEZJ01004137.1/:3281-4435(-)
MEWVYIPETDEPVVFESDPIPPETAELSKLDIFSSTLPFEQPVKAEEHEEDYYGDDDIVEERLAPLKVFEMFAGSVVPLADAPDFSDSIYPESTPSKKATLLTRRPRLPASETRSERLKRLRAEVESLASECSPNDELQHKSHLPDLTLLRIQLEEIEHNLNAELRPSRTVRLNPNAHPLPDSYENDHHPQSKHPVTVQMFSPNVSILQSLEKRVTAMEIALGIPRLDQQCEMIALAPLLEDVRTRLGLITDETLPQRLKKDAEDIARILQSELRDEKGTDIVRMARVLQKIEKWESVAESMPLVVQRLRCLKRVQDDAAQFMECLTVLNKQVDALQKRSETNNSLLGKVQRNLETNIGTVRKNIDVLNLKLSTVTVNEGTEQS